MRAIDLKCTLNQAFGGNANQSYSSAGLKGHTGADEACGWGTDILSYYDMLIYSLYPIDAPASDGYTAIYGIVETPLEVFEWTTGHVSRIDVKIGDMVKKGQVIGAEGNRGVVYQGGTLITLAMQAAGDRRGSHRHDQKRPVTRVRRTRPGYRYLQNKNGIYTDNSLGYPTYYEIVDYFNGYNGCVDPLAPLFNRDLFPGRTGYDVLLFQRALVKEGLFNPSDCIGTFGPKTASAAIALQRKWGITPMLGYIGPTTRARLNVTYTS